MSGATPSIGKKPADTPKPSIRVASPSIVIVARANENAARLAIARDRSETATRSATSIAAYRRFGPLPFPISAPGTFSQTRTRRAESLYGSGLIRTLCTTLKIAVLAPTPSASVSTTTIVKPGARRSVRSA